MQDFDKDVIDAIIQGKPGKGNMDEAKKDPTDTIKDSDFVQDEIVMVVDRSGSMSEMRADAEGGINSFIEENQKAGTANFTLVQFDSEYDVVHDHAPIETVGKYELMPRGMTALMDAIGRAFADAGGEEKDDHSKIGVIVTDGGENGSREWTRDKVFARIEELKGKGWDFIFLAANQDAIEAGSGYGFDSGTTLNFDSSNVQEGYKAASLYSVSSREMRGSSIQAKRMRSSEVMDTAVMSSTLGDMNAHVKVKTSTAAPASTDDSTDAKK